MRSRTCVCLIVFFVFASLLPLQGSAYDKTPRLSGKDVSLPEFLLLLSARESVGLTGRPADTVRAGKEFERLVKRVSESLPGDRDPVRTVSALNRVLFQEEGFAYDPAPGNPDNFLLDRVLARKKGNCLGLTFVYLSLAERLNIPLGGVYVPSHSFVRYDGNGARINVETGEGGTERDDAWYAEKYGLREPGPYLRTLGRREMIGVYIKNVGAAYSRMGREEEAVSRYREAAVENPGLPDVYYNAGVSNQRLGRTREAIELYRRALSLDPDKQSARGNLASALCGCGRVEDGIEEYRKVLEKAPDYAVARAGLAQAYFARGDYGASIEQCDRAIVLGWRFEPRMMEVLERHRSHLP